MTERTLMDASEIAKQMLVHLVESDRIGKFSSIGQEHIEQVCNGLVQAAAEIERLTAERDEARAGERAASYAARAWQEACEQAETRAEAAIPEAARQMRDAAEKVALGEAKRIERLPDMGDRRLSASNADRVETCYKLAAAIAALSLPEGGK